MIEGKAQQMSGPESSLKTCTQNTSRPTLKIKGMPSAYNNTVSVTADAVWIGNRIHRTLTIRNQK
jgi:hypothetical protein